MPKVEAQIRHFFGNFQPRAMDRTWKHIKSSDNVSTVPEATRLTIRAETNVW